MANIEVWANEKGYPVRKTLLYEGEELPLLSSFDWLVVMGGPMGVHDEKQYPWLVSERKFIRQSIATGKIVLGVCLGAQLIADAMGGKVTKNPHKEIGWHSVLMADEARNSPIFQALPREFMAFQWHGDTFSIPTGARRLAYSEACQDQAFEIGRAIGLQFHLESSKESIELLIENCGGDLAEGKYVQDAAKIRAGMGSLPEIKAILTQLLDRIDADYGRNPAETA
jgi:GMP synthase-like glutamine amidotransferase